MFTQEQKDFFETFGFLCVKQCFSPEETKAIAQIFDHIVLEERQGKEFTGEKRQSVYGFVENHPQLIHLIDDERIYQPMSQILGEDFTWVVSEAQLYVGETKWHPDQEQQQTRYIKVGMYLDPVRKDTGCLRVIPGSHREPFHSMLKQTVRGKEIHIQREIPSFPLESDPGDVIMFDMRLWHAAFGGYNGRRMMALNYSEYPASQEQIDICVANYNGVMTSIKEGYQYSRPERLFGDAFLYSDNPRFRAMTSRLVELGLK